MKTNILKVFTLITFVSLIMVFIAYRVGFFGNKKFSDLFSPNRSNTQNDSIPDTDSLERIEMIPSSKTMVLREKTTSSIKDNKLDSLTPDSISQKVKEALMKSSKSGVVFHSDDFPKIDSIPNDSIR